jgi:threonine/homoserine/homoserine lactone efflux protein
LRADLLASFLVAALVVQLVPGPGMLFILSQGIAGGRRAGVAAALGAASGMVVHTCAAALGLAALFLHAPAAYDVLRLVGGAYLLWMAIGHFRGSRRLAVGDTPRHAPPSKLVFRRACLNNLANPKVIAFYVAFLPQFVDRRLGQVPLQLLVLGFVFLLIGLAVDLPLGAFAGRAGEILRRRAGLRRVLDWVVGTILGVLGIRLLVTPR